jgi:hypothetical protein
VGTVVLEVTDTQQKEGHVEGEEEREERNSGAERADE